MNFIRILVVIIPLIIYTTATTNSSNITDNNVSYHQHQTKRTISPSEFGNYGENKPLVLYADSLGTPTSSSDYSNLYSNSPRVAAFPSFNPPSAASLKPVSSLFDAGDDNVPKQVAAQQVLYEYQQTPTNAVSNVHVNQFLQPIPTPQPTFNFKQDTANSQYVYSSQNAPAPLNNNNQYYQSAIQQQNGSTEQFPSVANTFAYPAQHSSLVHHGQNLALVQFQPQSVQTHQQPYVPGKYLYVNGKIIYQPNAISFGNHQQNYIRPGLATFQPTQRRYNQPNYLTYTNNGLQFVPKQNLVPPPRPLQQINRVSSTTSLPLPPTTTSTYLNKFIPPRRHQLQQITKGMSPPPPPVKEDVSEDVDASGESSPSNKANSNDDDNDEINEEENNDDDDDESKSNYHNQEDSEDDRRNNNEDDENDNNKPSSNYYRKYSFFDDNNDDRQRDNYKQHQDEVEDSNDDDDDNDSKRDASRQTTTKFTDEFDMKPSLFDYTNYKKFSENFNNFEKKSTDNNNDKKKKYLEKKRKSKKPKMHYKSIKYSKEFNSKPQSSGDRIEGKQSQHVPVIHKQKIFRQKWYVSKVTDDDDSSSES